MSYVTSKLNIWWETPKIESYFITRILHEYWWRSWEYGKRPEPPPLLTIIQSWLCLACNWIVCQFIAEKRRNKAGLGEDLCQFLMGLSDGFLLWLHFYSRQMMQDQTCFSRQSLELIYRQKRVLALLQSFDFNNAALRTIHSFKFAKVLPLERWDVVVSPGGGVHGGDDPPVEEGKGWQRKQPCRRKDWLLQIINRFLNALFLLVNI